MNKILIRALNFMAKRLKRFYLIFAALSTTSTVTLASTVDAVVHNRRICLVGSVIEDEATILAAQQLNLPIVTSATGSEYIADDSWITFFILREFEGPIYDAIYRSKHK